MNLTGKHIWFYDGECALCDRSVQFLLRRDKQHRFRVALLQSGFAQRELTARGVDPAELAAGARDPRAFKTFYLIANYGTPQEELLNRSRGSTFCLAQLDGGWGLYGRFLQRFPTWLLDPAYKLLNRLRYPLFGRLGKGTPASPEKQARLIR